MTCATLPTFPADDNYDQQALSSWRYPELGWLYCRWPNLQRCWIEAVEQFTASCHWVSNSGCFPSKTQTFPFSLSFGGHWLFVCLFLLRGRWGFYLGHTNKFIYNAIQYTTTRFIITSWALFAFTQNAQITHLDSSAENRAQASNSETQQME